MMGFKFEAVDGPPHCPYCHQPAKLVKCIDHFGDMLTDFDPNRLLWDCRPCDAYVLCHHGTKTPLGRMAKEDVRWKRRIIHNKITFIVSHGALKTKDVYKWIAELLGKPLVDIHISDLEDDKLDEVAQHCDRMIEKINAMNEGVTV